MRNTETQLTALIGSRICHDLISPIGAINNGLELLNMSGGPSGPEIGLIGESVDNASARIRFFRIAFGAAGDQKVGPAEVQSILRDLYGNSRLTIEWQVTEPVHRTAVRLAFLALMCAESAMPYGGRVRITKRHSDWQLEGTADRINLDDAMSALLAGQKPTEALQPSQVQFALLPLIARDEDRQVRLQSDKSALSICF
ncbi:histidine phosphotransferase family protein [Marimonas sp. MJW-29]|uniref:Histidine phosphotransferase family protein n=1 Tax=Sulfitobacter sediminis TaxID=3234186 RepID=A0ABV3RUT0_9RHOB